MTSADRKGEQLALAVGYIHHTDGYFWTPQRLLDTCIHYPRALGLWSLITRLWIGYGQPTVPLSDNDLRAYGNYAGQGRGTVLDDLALLTQHGFLIAQRQRGKKTHYTPAWGMDRQQQPRPWKRVKAWNRGTTKTVRVSNVLIDAYVGRFIPNATKPGTVDRYTSEPLSLGALGQYLLSLRGRGDGDQRDLVTAGLMTNGDPVPVPTLSDALATRTTTSNTITVQEVFLTATISPTIAFAGEPILQLLIEAKDSRGNLVPSYRGELDINPSVAISNLPQSVWNSSADYTFTAQDAGRHLFSNWSFNANGNQAITLIDRNYPSRTTTSNAVYIGQASFRVTVEPTTMIAKDRSLTMTLEIVDSNGQRITGYRGSIDLNPSTQTRGLPQGAAWTWADYTFTDQDAGIHTFANWGFNTVGNQTVTIIDRGNTSRQITTPIISVTPPPDPMPIDAGSPPSTSSIPEQIAPTVILTPSWGMTAAYTEGKIFGVQWYGVPAEMTLANPGVQYVVGMGLQRAKDAWAPSTFYLCPHLGWEQIPTSARDESYGVSYLPYQDPLFTGHSVDDHDPSTHNSGCSLWSDSYNEGAAVTFSMFSNPADIDVQGMHINVQGGSGNSHGTFSLIAAPPGALGECKVNDGDHKVGDPIDVRSGMFYLPERDLGVPTGCSNVDLTFERTYAIRNIASTSFSPGWVHNYQQRVIAQGNYALVQLPRGSLIKFKDVGTTVYASEAGSFYNLLKRSGGGWILVDRDRHADIFDAEGKLIARQDPQGNMIWLTYQPYSRDGVSGQRVARIDAPGGRYLWFGYDYYHPTRIIVVGDHAGRTVHYGYDQEDRLTTVTDPMGHDVQYLYQGTSWSLQSKLDQHGSPVFTNTYDGNGRVIRQINNQGQDLSLSYQIISDTTGIMANTNAGGTGHPFAPYLIETAITDQTGARATYRYGSDGILRQTTEPLGGVTHYRGHTVAGNPTEVEDAHGNKTFYTYNPHGLATSMTNALGQTTSFGYDQQDRITSITDALGNITTLTYNGSHLVEIRDALNQTTHFEYGDEAGWRGLLQKIIGQAGEQTLFDYNSAGDVTTITDALGHQTVSAYDILGRPIAVTDANGNTTRIQYDANDNIVAVTDPLSATVQFGYDPRGNLNFVRDQVGATAIITYTAGARPTAFRDAMGGVTQIGYGPLGRPITITNQLGQQSLLTYDKGGRVVVATDPLGYQTRYGYDILGNTTVITDANGHATHITYDALSRPLMIRDAENHVLQYGYDAVGNVVVQTNTLGLSNHVVYDALGRPVKLIDQLGKQTQYQYNTAGLLELVTDANGIHSKYQYNPLGQLTASIDNYIAGGVSNHETNVTTSYAYDAVGNMIRVTDPRQSITQFGYDPRGFVTSITDPLSRTMSYQYDARGLPIRWIKADSSVVTYTYNLNGQATGYTAGDITTSYTYNAVGQRTTMQDETGITSYEYNGRGQATAITQHGQRVEYTYDGVGNRKTLKYPDGSVVTTIYNAINQRLTMTDGQGGTVHYGYNAAGQPNSITYPNGVTATLQYDQRGALSNLAYSQGTQFNAQFQYQYDATGRVIASNEQTTGTISGTMINDTAVFSYTYDPLYRLIDANAGEERYQYTYDAAGNPVTSINPTEAITTTYDAANQILARNGIAFQYDANGNLLYDGLNTYTYNRLDQLRTISSAPNQTMRYNGDGLLTDQATVYDLNHALPQMLVSHGTTVVPGIGQRTNGVMSYWHPDRLGSIRAVSGDTGNLQQTMRFTPFGEVASINGSSAVARGISGEPTNNGLTYLRSRFYNPRLGRFMTPDAIIPDWTSGQNWNQYAYVLNDPLNWVDPSGFERSFLESVDDLNDEVTARFWRGWDRVKKGFNQWWNEQPCNTCQLVESLSGTAINQGISIWGLPPLASLYSVNKVTSVFEQRSLATPSLITNPNGGIDVLRPAKMFTDWRPLKVIRNIRLLPTNLPKVGDVLYSNADDMTQQRVTSVKQFAGLRTAGVVGGLLSGVGRFVQDLIDNPCLTRGQRISRIFWDSIWGAGINIGVTALTGRIANPVTRFFTAYGASALLSLASGPTRNHYKLP